MSLFLFIIGLTLLLAGSRGVIKNAILISQLTKIPPFIIGATIVALGTSLPEIVISFLGGLEKASDLALGNIVGSNIANSSLILGFSLLIHPLYIGKTKTQKNMLVTLLITVALFLTLIVDGISRILGLLFVVLGFVIIIWQIRQGKNSEIIEELEKEHIKHPVLRIILFSLSLAVVFLGGKILIDNGIILAKVINVPPTIIGITAVALGTSLPELAVSIVALSKKVTRTEEKLVVGNLLGSNIFNIVFGSGTLGLFGVKHFSNPLSLYAFLFTTIEFCLLIYLFKGRTIPKYIGAGLILFYIVYLLFLLLMPQ